MTTTPRRAWIMLDALRLLKGDGWVILNLRDEQGHSAFDDPADPAWPADDRVVELTFGDGVSTDRRHVVRAVLLFEGSDECRGCMTERRRRRRAAALTDVVMSLVRGVLGGPAAAVPSPRRDAHDPAVQPARSREAVAADTRSRLGALDAGTREAVELLSPPLVALGPDSTERTRGARGVAR